ncbi:Uncharacterised protein [Klebsiella aerogenes]|nr:Uncharacterised protein [Klebsiella aerogenes]
MLDKIDRKLLALLQEIAPSLCRRWPMPLI